jgi:diguanylate cyclase (GGDEF)-like protein
MTPSLAGLQACTDTAWQAAPDLPLRLALVAGLLMLAGWAGAQRFFAGQRAFVGLLLVMVGWIGVSSVEHAAALPDCKASLALLAWPILLTQPVLWALFLHQYVQSEGRLPPWRTRLAAGLPWAGLIVAALSNGQHGLFYGPDTALSEAPIAGLHRMRYAYGPFFVAAATWGHAWLAASFLMVLRARQQAQGSDRRQWSFFIAMMLAPWVANAAYIGLGWRLMGGDPTPLTFAAAVVGFGWLVRSDALFKVVPLARRLLFTEMPDPVLVLDPGGRVMDANTAAVRLAGGRLPPGGTTLTDWPRFGTPLAALLAAPPQHRAALQLSAPEAVFEVRVRDIGEAQHQVGRLVQLRDVTERHRAQARLVQTLAERNAQLAQVASLQAELREQALRDPLTGLHNRRALDQRFELEARHQDNTGQPLAVVLLDVDHFKRINDEAGHAVGDAVLRELAQRLRDSLRDTDTVYRFGGEEFALLMPGAHRAQAAARTDALRQQLQAQPLQAVAWPVSFSAGVAERGPQGLGLDELLRAADSAMYRAKHEGRNRVLTAD